MSASECATSPASQGGLERYVGSCLISASARVKKSPAGPPGPSPAPLQRQGAYNPPKKTDTSPRGQQQYGAATAQPGPTRHYTWSGMPLISVASNNNRRNRKQSDHHEPVSRQAARPAQNRPQEQENRTPLSRLAIHTQGAPLILAGRFGGAGRKNAHPGPPVRVFRGGDGRRSNGSPPGNASPKSVPSTPSSDSLSVASDESSGHSENSLPRIIKPRKRRKKDRKPPPMSTNSAAEGVPTVSLKALADSAAPTQDADEPQLIHDFEDVKEADSVFLPSSGSDASSCQCRYCDPSGLIWDVDRHCYSPFLTPPSSLLFSDLSPTTDLFSGHSELVLRRSWSEPSPPASERRPPSATSSPPSSALSSVSTQSLEVSSEIVTSHNGHRDIEIKFFSASTPVTPPATPLATFPDTPPPSPPTTPSALCCEDQCSPAHQKSSIGEELRRHSESESVQ